MLRLKTSRPSSHPRTVRDEGELPPSPRRHSLLREQKCPLYWTIARETPFVAEERVAGRSRGYWEFQTHLHPNQLSPGLLVGNGSTPLPLGSPEANAVAPYDQMHPCRWKGWIPTPTSVATSRARTIGGRTLRVRKNHLVRCIVRRSIFIGFWGVDATVSFAIHPWHDRRWHTDMGRGCVGQLGTCSFGSARLTHPGIFPRSPGRNARALPSIPSPWTQTPGAPYVRIVHRTTFVRSTRLRWRTTSRRCLRPSAWSCFVVTYSP